MLSFDLAQIDLEALNQRTLSVYHPQVLNGGEDLLIFCEHPRTLSLGKNFKGFTKGELPIESWKERNFSIVHCDRGGQATYHGPGHLMIYPVVNLKAKKIGIKKFIDIFLDSILKPLQDLGLNCFIDCEKLGIWIDLGVSGKFKVLSLGLRLDRGVSRHGASLYLDGDMEPFKWFSPCGDIDTNTISIKKIYDSRDLLPSGMDFSTLKYILSEQISNNLGSALVNI